jgi:hypothetical protein
VIPRARLIEVTEADIRRLIDDGAREARTVDFTEAAALGEEKMRDEFDLKTKNALAARELRNFRHGARNKFLRTSGTDFCKPTWLLARSVGTP